ncbi:hypothetical protein [Natronosalvus halobius]|uniref:hypothetical protein n=1 Tax=Natronosalvus halobius TaxID=2953746 RepID=UPI0020A0DED6|nr:hypothetical protein [Natronosalvus halobius]USZ73179.1 hypothetical protein NGM15_07735 [Natronosalvus halobius]
MSDKSKPIADVDEEAKKLLIEVMDGEDSGGFDVDSIYYIDGRGWVVVEFLKCDSVRPSESHPNRYWFNKQKFLNLWRLATDLDGELVLVNYEDSRDQFKVIEVEEMDERGIREDTQREMEYEEFQEYFVGLNRSARGESSG